ncbi:MAG: hypothetical protein KME42_05125 [Tildeniella nuda ZEHNDER 1965/U140]|jgi:hypothetical protein|nr:hypothetical protein [Tildeniella nuda ZEHNDER 1965/U140]
MPESLDLHSLFRQLQTRYPTSGLLTELVQIHADHFVVRALVQLGSMTLATSLSNAATVEQAEDQARLRVLALLGIHPAPSGIPAMPAPNFSAPTNPLMSAFKDMTRFPKTLDGGALQDGATSITSPGAEGAIAPPSPFPTLAFEPALIPDVPVPFSTASVDPSAATPYVSEMELDTSDALPDGVLLDDALPSYDDAPDDTPSPYDDEPFEEPEPLTVEEATGDRASTDDASPTATEEPAPKSKPRKPSASKDPAAPEADTSGSASRDLSSLISQIGVEIDRIGWSKRQGSTYLQKTYGKKTRSELTDDELEDFLTYLNTQPSATVTP